MVTRNKKLIVKSFVDFRPNWFNWALTLGMIDCSDETIKPNLELYFKTLISELIIIHGKFYSQSWFVNNS
jgi:hypothetical protein